jgi:hypothetical protein
MSAIEVVKSPSTKALKFNIMKILLITLGLLGISSGASFAHFLPKTEPIKVIKMTQKSSYIRVFLDTSHIKPGTYYDCVAYGSDGIPFETSIDMSSPRVSITLIQSFDTPSVFSVECYPR